MWVLVQRRLEAADSCRVWSLGGLGFRIEGLGFRVEGLGLKVQGSGVISPAIMENQMEEKTKMEWKLGLYGGF